MKLIKILIFVSYGFIHANPADDVKISEDTAITLVREYPVEFYLISGTSRKGGGYLVPIIMLPTGLLIKAEVMKISDDGKSLHFTGKVQTCDGKVISDSKDKDAYLLIADKGVHLSYLGGSWQMKGSN